MGRICSMNNLWSYCGLIDAKIRAFDKDLPVGIGSSNMSEHDTNDTRSVLRICL